jgi:RNA polymerase sigma-70 factor (ECF subfamily)
VPRQDAGDLVQEVFLLALRAISRLEDAKRVGPWRLTIARNRGRDAHKSKRHVVALAEVEEIAQGTDAGHGEARLEEEQEAERALDTVRGLPDAYRETLILRLVEGLSGPEIAERTGMTHGSVRVNLHRGMKILRERLAQAGGR